MSAEQPELTPQPEAAPKKESPAPKKAPAPAEIPADQEKVVTVEAFARSLQVPRFAVEVIAADLRKAVGKTAKIKAYKEAYDAYSKSKNGTIPAKKK